MGNDILREQLDEGYTKGVVGSRSRELNWLISGAADRIDALAAENERLRKALATARDVIATMADCLSPLVTEALVGDPLAEIDTALAHKETV